MINDNNIENAGIYLSMQLDNKVRYLKICFNIEDKHPIRITGTVGNNTVDKKHNMRVVINYTFNNNNGNYTKNIISHV